jgi:TolB-like protein/tetratricopeptide (TPR) repeat protein
MPDDGMTFTSLVAELKERRVFRTVLIYVAIAWLIIQAVDIMGPALFLPAWTTTLVIVLLVLGLPFAVLLAWRFDIVGGEAQRQASPEGKAATYIWLAFSVVTLIGGSWLAHYSYTQTMAADDGVHASFGAYSPPNHSIAVLPFVNLSGNPDNEYFGDGLADTVLHRLAQVDQLFVIARTSSFRFKGSSESIESIGRKLNVGAVLEGSVQQVGNQMRIIAQLIDARSGKHLQSLTFDASADDIFGVQDEISLQVARALEIELLKGVTDKLTASGTGIPKAHDLYMLGRFHAGKYTPEGVRKGHEFFKQAITLDPTFVLAYVGVADTLMRSPRFEQVPGTVLQAVHNTFSQQAFSDLDDAARYAQARDALNTALVLDDQSAEAYAMLGYLETWLGDRSKAEPLFQRAIELRPGFADAHYFYGRYLGEERRYSDALVQLQRALELDPANIPILLWTNFLMRRDFESMKAATVMFDRIAELDPGNEFGAYRNPTILYTAWINTAEVGRYVDAVAWLETELALNPNLPVNVLTIGQTYMDLGDTTTGERWRVLAAQSPHLYEDHNGLGGNWFLLLRQERYDDARALVDAAFGDNPHPMALNLKALVDVITGQYDSAIELFASIPHPYSDAIFFSDEELLSGNPGAGIYYAFALMQSGEERRAEDLLLRIEEFNTFFRQQGFATPIIDYTDAQIHAIRGAREKALEALKRSQGRMYRWPVQIDPIFDELRDDPEFQAIFADLERHKAEELQLLREHHREPPPWSPDYPATE